MVIRPAVEFVADDVLDVSHIVIRNTLVGSSKSKSLDEYDIYIETFLPGSPSAFVRVIGHLSFAFVAKMAIKAINIDSKILFIILSVLWLG